MKPTLEQATVCATGDRLTYDKDRGGYNCGGCGRHFRARSVNVHVYAARRRVSEASVRVERGAS